MQLTVGRVIGLVGKCSPTASQSTRDRRIASPKMRQKDRVLGQAIGDEKLPSPNERGRRTSDAPSGFRGDG